MVKETAYGVRYEISANLLTSIIGTIVEQHNVIGLETGYSVEFFDIS